MVSAILPKVTANVTLRVHGAVASHYSATLRSTSRCCFDCHFIKRRKHTKKKVSFKGVHTQGDRTVGKSVRVLDF